MTKTKSKRLPKAPEMPETVSITFASNQGDFQLVVEGGDMNCCKGTFMELFGKVRKSVKMKEKEKKRLSAYR